MRDREQSVEHASDSAEAGSVPRQGREPHWMFNLRWNNPGADLDYNVVNYNALVAAGTLRKTPAKAEIRKGGPAALLEGWLPAEPIIGPDTRVVAMGSCFASIFVEWLAEHGYNRAFDPASDESLIRNPLESPLVVAQQFRWAFGEFDSDLAFWITPDKVRVEATEERREHLREAFSTADVMIITLGLAEGWIDNASGEAIWRYPPREHRTERFRFAITSVAETVAALETIDRLRRMHAPQAKVVYTVSPIRLAATFRPISPIVANIASKSILRAALDEFLRAHASELNETYFYFPSYEVVTELIADPYDDWRHVHPHHADLVIDLFARHYTTLPSTTHVAFSESVEDELRETISYLEDTTIPRLEKQVEWLQQQCDERLGVIERLDAACNERLSVIEGLRAQGAKTSAVDLRALRVRLSRRSRRMRRRA